MFDTDVVLPYRKSSLLTMERLLSSEQQRAGLQKGAGSGGLVFSLDAL